MSLSMSQMRSLMARLPARGPAELLRLLWKHAEKMTPVPTVDLTIGTTAGTVLTGVIVDCADDVASLHLDERERGSLFIDLHSVQWVGLGILPKDLLIALSNQAIGPVDFEPHLSQVELMKAARKVAADHQSQGGTVLEVKIDGQLDLAQSDQRRLVQGTLLYLEKLLEEWRNDPKTLTAIGNDVAGFHLGASDYAYQERTLFVPVTATSPTFAEFQRRLEALL